MHGGNQIRELLHAVVHIRIRLPALALGVERRLIGLQCRLLTEQGIELGVGGVNLRTRLSDLRCRTGCTGFQFALRLVQLRFSRVDFILTLIQLFLGIRQLRIDRAQNLVVDLVNLVLIQSDADLIGNRTDGTDRGDAVQTFKLRQKLFLEVVRQFFDFHAFYVHSCDHDRHHIR